MTKLTPADEGIIASRRDAAHAHLIPAIATRASKLASEFGTKIDSGSIALAVHATHQKHPLKLQELLEADDGNFGHDVFGIMRFLNPETGELGECFLPRFAV